MDTIDIEDFAGKVKSSLVKMIVDGVSAEFPNLVVIPIIGNLFKLFIEIIADIITGKLGFAAFVINTGIFTRDQAEDYLMSLRRIDKLPADVSDEDWEKAEDEANHAFHNLVRFSA